MYVQLPLIHIQFAWNVPKQKKFHSAVQCHSRITYRKKAQNQGRQVEADQCKSLHYLTVLILISILGIYIHIHAQIWLLFMQNKAMDIKCYGVESPKLSYLQQQYIVMVVYSQERRVFTRIDAHLRPQKNRQLRAKGYTKMDSMKD